MDSEEADIFAACQVKSGQTTIQKMNHRKILISVFVAMTAFGSAQAQRVKGSDTLLPLTQELAEEYLEEHPDSSVIVTGGGSGVGISALMENTTDIAMASRRIKFGEKMKFAEAGLEAEEVIVAYDALAVVVNPSNPVSKLTREQLEAIFRGKITNWKEVGGADAPIVVVGRDTSSGTYGTWQEMIMDAGEKTRVTAKAQVTASSGAMLATVSKNPNAIGYEGMGYVNDTVKGLKVEGVAASAATARNGQYPLSRFLYMFTNGWPQGEVLNFLMHMQSDAGQKIVNSTGYVSLREVK